MTPAAASPTLVDALLSDRDRAARTMWLVSLVILGTIAITISAKINIPFWPVPMTMQTFVVTVIGLAYGSRLAGATVGLYLLEGALGLP
jgi:biotin transport system substrate-specific component